MSTPSLQDVRPRGHREALSVEALHVVIRHERESTIACLRAELEQTRAERDEAYEKLSHVREVAEWEINATDSYTFPYKYIRQHIDRWMNGELYGNAMRRG